MAVGTHSDDVAPETKVLGAIHNLQKSEGTFEHLTFEAEAEMYCSLGIFIKRAVITGVKHGSCLQGIVMAGDVLESVNGHTMSDETQRNREIIARIIKPETAIGSLMSHLNKELKLSISVLRMKAKTSEQVLLPEKITAKKFFSYEYINLYWLKGLDLGLELKDIEEKCFVVGLEANGIANMGLSIGDRLIDINGQLVESASNATSLLLQSFGSKGFVRICIEMPACDTEKNQLRSKIQASLTKDGPLDIPLGPDALECANTGVWILQTTKPGKSIIRETVIQEDKNHHNFIATKIHKKKKKRVSFHENSTEFGVFVENKTRLFVSVPGTKTVQSEAVKCKTKRKKKGKKSSKDGLETAEEKSVDTAEEKAPDPNSHSVSPEKSEGGKKENAERKNSKENLERKNSMENVCKKNSKENMEKKNSKETC